MRTIINFIKKLLRKPKHTHHAGTPEHVIPGNQHSISKADISTNALNVLTRLHQAGFQAYLVGGGVRDLLLGKAPKDFDVSTDATPQQIRRLFRNARIIGRRFKLAHILYHREIIEVSTFRGHAPVDANQQTNEHGMLIRDNVYGTLEDDAWRRDFTVNALYYCEADEAIVDLTGGLADISSGLLRMIGEPAKRYQEDPVRMLRAIRFCAKLDFQLTADTADPISSLNHLILHVSGSRLFDEMIKLYQSGHALRVQELLVEYGLFAHLFPQANAVAEHYPVYQLLNLTLENTDKRIQADKPVTPAFIYAALLWFPVLAEMERLKSTGIEALSALEQAMSNVITQQNKIVSIPKRFTQIIREIWLLQFRFHKRTGTRAYQLLGHPRFRAAYDFLALRALANDGRLDLAEWWTVFQDAPEEQQVTMIKALVKKTIKVAK